MNNTNKYLNSKNFQKEPPYINEFQIDYTDKKNYFLKFLSRYVTEYQIESLYTNYAIGASDYHPVFWYINKDGIICNGRIVPFRNLDNKIIDTEGQHSFWIKNTDDNNGNNIPQNCLFGEHLLKLYPDDEVIIVANEYTAILGFLIRSEYNWLSCTGKNGLTIEKLSVLENKTVILVPELEFFSEWEEKAEEIKMQLNCKLSVVNFFDKFLPSEKHIMQGRSTFAETIMNFLMSNRINYEFDFYFGTEYKHERNSMETLINKLQLIENSR